MEKIKVAIVEDDPEWLQAIQDFLSEKTDMEVTGTAQSREEAVQLARFVEADVILMDINLSGNKCDGIHAAAEIHQFSKAKIIMMTSLEEEEIIKNSFIAGAVNYILKTQHTEIPNAIRATYYRSSPFEVLLKDYSRLKEEEILQKLTPAERELFDLLAQGYTQSQIAAMLFKTERTIKNQVNKILKKMEVNKSKEAVRKVRTRGLLSFKSKK